MEESVLGQRALIIDDDPSIRNLLATLMRREGFDVETASDGEEGIRRIEDETARYDVVVLDLMMPRVDGHAVVARIQAARPWMMDRVIVATAFPQAAMGRVGFACPILPKPFDLDELLKTVRRQLATAAPLPGPRGNNASL